MANLTWSTDTRDRVALLLLGDTFANLTPNQAALMDGGSTVATVPPKGVALDAWREVQQLGQWFEMAGATTTSDVGEGYLVAETAYRMALSVRPERIEQLRKLSDDSMRRYVRDFSRVGATANPSSTLAAPTVQSIRFHCLSFCYNQDPPVKISPDEIDTASLWVLNWLWNKSEWSFRRRQCTGRILALNITGGNWTQSNTTITDVDTTGYTNTTGAMAYLYDGTSVANGVYTISSTTSTTVVLNSSISVTGQNLSNADIGGTLCAVSIFGLESGESMDFEATRNLYYSGTVRDVMQWGSSEKMASLRAAADDEALGKPYLFRLERRNNAVAWLFYPWPDDTYDFRFEALIATPAAPTTVSDTAPFSKFPPEFQQVYKDLVLGKLLMERTTKDAMWKRAVDEIERFAPIYDNQSDADVDTGTRDIYGDIYSQAQVNDNAGYGGEMP